jgi:hypothetical protein
MPFVPNTTVTIGGIAYVSKSLAGLTITYGRTTVWESARSGYAQIEILNLTDVNNAFEIGQSVVVTIQNSASVNKTIFTGTLIDVTSRIGDSGNVSQTTIQTITAVSVFAQMARTSIGGAGYPVQTDTARMTAILTEAGVTIDVVDSPFVYTFAARAANLGDAYSIAATYSSQAFGYIYETTDNKVGFANESHRLNDVQLNGYYNIPENNILFSGVASQRTRNDIVNRVVLTYDPALTVTAEDAASVSVYGLAAAQITTEISNTADAQIITNRYVAVRAIPQNNMAAFTVMLESPNVSNATIDRLTTIYMGLPIQIQNLPLALNPSTYKGFVEGWSFQISQKQTSLTMITTDATFSLTPTRWQDVDPAQTWASLAATLPWYLYE